MRTTLGTAAADDDVRAAIHRLGPSFERSYIAHLTLAHWADIMGSYAQKRFYTDCRLTEPQRMGYVFLSPGNF